MKLTMFHAGKGDCLLLTSRSGERLLMDGGVATAYRDHVAKTLGKLRDKDERIDVVCVSHIDDDHIGGILQLLDDEVGYRAYEYQRETGNTRARKPDDPRPPEIGRIWHNGFSDQVGQDAAPIERTLTRCSQVLSGAAESELLRASEWQRNLVADVGQALRLARRINDKQLKIPLNPEFGGKLMMARRSTPTLSVGSMQGTVIGPTDESLRKLRRKWDDWVKKSQQALEEMEEQAREDEERMGPRSSRLRGRIAPAAIDSREIARTFDAAFGQAQDLWARTGSLTEPNLASIMLLMEEDGKAILLPGDGHIEDVCSGLEQQKKLKDGRLHVNVLKVPHHGSENNYTRESYDVISADHYLFCANGSDTNPEIEVLTGIAASRDSDEKPFTFWFNTTADTTEAKLRDHMVKVEECVTQLADEYGGRMQCKFLEKGDSMPVPFG